ncbi:AAA family ATPase [Sneathiella sp. P13V-1]|uniref:KGGVGR-motif variant AAA ATPase n=1 Tax=Sneathiella sp. P13V-1 TaxID=2697366 RepID=UPI00187B2347|nr:AAA family ATPase [Sneathiella sp. P13V-1]MBE7635472.1 AAA family ATPase [Sneathiella sp. P13V-1]
MHVVTFYSYKGGVGRTLALTNCAAEFAKRGKKVLIVDFDLEAPGITSIDTFKECAGKGVVEYISDYMHNDLKAPDISGYIRKCDKWLSTTNKNNETVDGEIWVMPAGDRSQNYEQNLQGLDWQLLYSEYSGFLLMEEMRNQWEAVCSPDYVLIDSRTGHTDVSGICTRQLPDSVVIVFVPNTQNLDGLTKVVESIRDEALSQKSGLERCARVLFTPSRLPTIDDEEQILKSQLETSSIKLNYRKAAASIYHYESLELFTQSLFTLHRPNTKLSKDYCKLVDAISIGNFEDKIGVLKYLQKQASITISQLTNNPFNSDNQIIDPGREQDNWADTKSKILSNFNTDEEVTLSLAQVEHLQGNSEEAVSIFDHFSLSEQDLATTHFSYAQALEAIGNTEKANASYLNVINKSRYIEGADIELRAVSKLANTYPKSLDLVDVYRLLENSPIEHLLEIVRNDLLVDGVNFSKRTEFAYRVVKALEQTKLNKEELNLQRHTLTMLNIATRRFPEATDVIFNNMEQRTIKMFASISDAFNASIALWGLEGRPDKSNFVYVLKLFRQYQKKAALRDPNILFCIGITKAVCGETNEAIQILEQSAKSVTLYGSRAFSPWRYREVTSNVFKEDIQEAIKTIKSDNHIRPWIIYQDQERLPLLN